MSLEDLDRKIRLMKRKLRDRTRYNKPEDLIPMIVDALSDVHELLESILARPQSS